jgi:mono/diheme cytochrome c family protein
MTPRYLRFLLWLAFAVASTPGVAADGAAVLRKDCASCHNLTGPAPATLEALKARKGPDLFYAGNKYRREWIEKWLQNPQRIRPAGMLYVNHIKPGAKHEEIDTGQLADHARLAPVDAAAVADALMKLRAHDDLIANEKIEPGTISTQMGEMVFDKFSGCLACHLIEPEYGGVSGPELYTAAARLTPEFIASYIRNPQAWDPKTWMPNKHISDANIQKLVRYFDALAKESSHAK